MNDLRTEMIARLGMRYCSENITVCTKTKCC